ncbi:MAG: patatin-like phospholipase family protein [Pseudomonadota bacterium]
MALRDTNSTPARDTATPALQPRIGLALGGGGARGLAHILALEVFDELGIKPHIISGTSIGAIFGAAYASGLSASQIRAHAEEMLSNRTDMVRQLFSARNQPIRRVLSVFQLRSALLNPESLLDLVMPTRTASEFEDLQIPLRIVAADFYTQDQLIFDAGPLQPAIAASMALPALFAPVEAEDEIKGSVALMDGGIVNPLPFDTIADDVDITVAIDVSGAGQLPGDRKPPSAFEAIVASAQIVQKTIVREKLKLHTPDVLVEVDVGRFHVLEFHKMAEVLDAAQDAKDELRIKLERVLSAETLPTIDAPPPIRELREPTRPRSIGRRPKRTEHRTDRSEPASGSGKRPRLADRLLGTATE